ETNRATTSTGNRSHRHHSRSTRRSRPARGTGKTVRVVAGSAGGLALAVPKTDLRPTMDRVRGAIFSSLGELIVGARVLDLFAGTGALGIEALSRGAANVVFVENDHRSVSVIEKNLAHTHLSGTVHALDIFTYLDRLATPESFDIIFADPPYAKAAGE